MKDVRGMKNSSNLSINSRVSARRRLRYDREFALSAMTVGVIVVLLDSLSACRIDGGGGGGGSDGCGDDDAGAGSSGFLCG